MNSRAKGKRGELELVHWLRERGVMARRGQQYAGGTGSPDIIHDLPGLHLEVKRTERLRLGDAMAQAIQDAGGCMPSVWHRANQQEWLVTIRATDFLGLWRIGSQDRDT